MTWHHTCHDMNPPFPYECAACVKERIDAALERGSQHFPPEPASWIDRWHEEHEARMSALETIRVLEHTNRVAFDFIRTFSEKLGEHARVGVLGQLWLEAQRLLGANREHDE